jgi:hypothetical protein
MSVGEVRLRIRERGGPLDEWMVGFGHRVRRQAEIERAEVDVVEVSTPSFDCADPTVRVQVETFDHEAGHSVAFVDYILRVQIEDQLDADDAAQHMLAGLARGIVQFRKVQP